MILAHWSRSVGHDRGQWNKRLLRPALAHNVFDLLVPSLRKRYVPPDVIIELA
jgi:hypothetical protein